MRILRKAFILTSFDHRLFNHAHKNGHGWFIWDPKRRTFLYDKKTKGLPDTAPFLIIYTGFLPLTLLYISASRGYAYRKKPL